MKNKSPEFIGEYAQLLRDTVGRRAQGTVSRRVVSQRPSIQGAWTEDTFPRSWNPGQPLGRTHDMRRWRDGAPGSPGR